MNDSDMNKIQHYLTAIPWASATTMSPEADELAHQHIAHMRRVLEERARITGGTLLKAYADAQSAGYQAEEYEDFLRMLFRDVDFRSAPAKEPLILTIASFYFWDQDPDLGHFENPWAPLMKLYEQGYTSTFNEDEDANTLDIVIEYQEGNSIYSLV